MVSKFPVNTSPLDLDKTLVIEVCENCSSHQWNTRHDANKYFNYAMQSKFKLKVSLPYRRDWVF